MPHDPADDTLPRAWETPGEALWTQESVAQLSLPLGALAGLDAVNEVIVLDDGHALERGTHAELLAGGGRYWNMWARELEGCGSR